MYYIQQFMCLEGRGRFGWKKSFLMVLSLLPSKPICTHGHGLHQQFNVRRNVQWPNIAFPLKEIHCWKHVPFIRLALITYILQTHPVQLQFTENGVRKMKVNFFEKKNVMSCIVYCSQFFIPLENSSLIHGFRRLIFAIPLTLIQNCFNKNQTCYVMLRIHKTYFIVPLTFARLHHRSTDLC